MRGRHSPSPWGVGGGPKFWAGRKEISHLELQCPSCARMTTLVGPHRNKVHWNSVKKKKKTTPKFSRQASIWIPKSTWLLLFSRSVMSYSLRPHGLQHARLPCPSPTPGACSNSCPSSWWCHPTLSSSVIPFSSCLQSFPALESFLIIRLFASGGQSIGASASASVRLINIQDWFPKYIASYVVLAKSLSLRIPCP